jgi:hypothetical protein
MRRRFQSAPILTGLAVLGILLAGGREAQAAGIKVTGGFKVGGSDPPYDYIFKAYLEPGYSIQSFSGDNFKIDALVGVTPPNFPKPGDLGSFHTEPSNPPTVIWNATIGSPPVDPNFPYKSDITWSFFGNTTITNSGTKDLFLGRFAVETTVNFASPPYIAGTIIDYSWTTNGGTQSGTGSFPIIDLNAVPEPSSAVLLLTAAGALPLFWIRHRRRWRREQGP